MEIEELLVMSEHYNGYKRESAVIELGLLGNPSALPALIERVNDWVPRIRIESRNSITSMAIKKNTYAFVENLPNFYKLKLRARDHHESFINYIESYVTSSENAKAVVDGLQSSNALVVRACMTLCINYNLLDKFSISKIGLSHSDIIVRCRASELIREFDGVAQQELLSLAISDRFMPVRREALRIAVGIGARDEFVAPYLFDRHPSIREIAIKRLADSREYVSRAYKSALVSQSAFTICCGIWGVGAIGEVSNLTSIENLLTSQYSSVRKQAITTLFKINPSIINDSIKQLLSDISPAVAKEAARIARKLSVSLGAYELCALIENSSYEHTYAICFSVSKKINKWERIIYLLEMIRRNKNSSIFNLRELIAEIKRWDIDYNNSSSQPSAIQFLAVSNLFSEVDSMLGEECRRKLSFTLSLLK